MVSKPKATPPVEGTLVPNVSLQLPGSVRLYLNQPVVLAVRVVEPLRATVEVRVRLEEIRLVGELVVTAGGEGADGRSRNRVVCTFVPSLPEMVTGVEVVIGIEVIVEVIEQVGLGVQLVGENEGVDQILSPKIHMALLKTCAIPAGILDWVQVVPSEEDIVLPGTITHILLLKTRKFEIHSCPPKVKVPAGVQVTPFVEDQVAIEVEVPPKIPPATHILPSKLRMGDKVS